MKKDYYEILGVPKDASEEDLRRQYRSLSKKYHPDMQSGKSDAEKKDAEDRFKDINEAYSVLSDKDKRARYDSCGSADDFGGGVGGFNFGGMDPAEFFKKMNRGFGMDFGEDFGFGGPRRGGRKTPTAEDLERPEDGDDLAMQIRISFKDAVFGCRKEFDLDLDKECPVCGGTGAERGAHPEKCPDCDGSGYITQISRRGWAISQIMSPCGKCGGTGFSVKKCPECGGAKRVAEKKRVKVRVPAGARDGMRLRLKGMGRAGIKGGADGSLYLTVRVEPSDVFEREGDDIYVKVYASPSLAALGGKLDVPTPYGYRKIKIEPGLAGGTKLKVSGGGVKPETGPAGDMIVEFEIEPYSSMTPEQRDLIEKLMKSESPDNFRKASELSKKAAAFYGAEAG